MKNFLGIRDEWIRPLPKLSEMFVNDESEAEKPLPAEKSSSSEKHSSRASEDLFRRGPSR